jgi:hypothetical protein
MTILRSWYLKYATQATIHAIIPNRTEHPIAIPIMGLSKRVISARGHLIIGSITVHQKKNKEMRKALHACFQTGDIGRNDFIVYYG